MTRAELECYIHKTFFAEAEYLWERYPSYAVFRHETGRKWFAVIMSVPKSKFGIDEDGCVDVVNLKCSEEIIDSFRSEPGIHPAYHMSRGLWLSVFLDGTVPDDTVKLLLAVSYKQTEKRTKKEKTHRTVPQ